MKVLAIDDQHYILTAIKSILKSSGHEIHIALNAQQGIDLYKEHSHDIILMDYNMPGVNGIEATKQLIEYDPNVKICFLSAHSSIEAVKKALSAGAVNYISKPIDRDILLTKLKEIHLLN